MFRRTTQRYGQTPEPVTPYQRAEQMWDERIGSARVQARNWRLMAFGSLGLSIVLVGWGIWQSSQSRIVPYVVEVDKIGQVHAVGPAIRSYNPTDAEIARDLGNFIYDVRSLSFDPVVVKHHWDLAGYFATSHAKAFINDYARQIHLDTLIGHRTVSLQIDSIVRASDSSFEVRWTEQAFQDDAPQPAQHWTAVLSYVIHKPDDDKALHINPLGIYVNAIDWSREFAAQ